MRECGRTLVVRDGVEVREGGIGVGGGQFDGMRGVALVRLVGANSAEIGAEPALRELGGFDEGERRHERGERLVQPQPVPPLHRDQVPEPHVRHLVQDHA